MAARRSYGRGIRRWRSYTVDETARMLGVAKGTVRRWIATDLPAITDRKPALILGSDLVDYLAAKGRPKQECRLHECYCFGCREPRAPAFRAAEFFPINPTSGNLRALCEHCATVMHKRVPTARLDELRAILDVTIRQADQHIDDRMKPCLNDDLQAEG